jgi:serine protease inhibitor
MKRCNDGLVTCAAIGTLLLPVVALVGCGGDGASAAVQSPTSSTPGSTSSTTPTAVALAVKNDAPVDPAIVSADNAFGLSLLDALLPGNSGQNIAISPLSVALALQVLYNGAAGSTQQSMAQTLDLGALSVPALNNDNAALQASLVNADPAVQLTVANSLWVNLSGGPVLASFTQTDQTYYGAMLGDISGAPANVNAWVDTETQGLITELLPPGVYNTAIIANVLYFKGQWTTSFDPSKTAAAPFTLSDGSQISAELMNQTGTFPYASGTLHGSNFQAVQMPYGDGRFNLLIVLPDVTTDITSFVTDMTAQDLNGLRAQLIPSTVAIALPRFTASYGNSLVGALTSLGMGVAFGPSADFSALAPGFSVDVVEHKTVVEVDETGTVAAAATGIGVATVVTLTHTMVMNHPFLYAIQDSQTGELLFIGILMNPT